jgi:hypothetical protein
MFQPTLKPPWDEERLRSSWSAARRAFPESKPFRGKKRAYRLASTQGCPIGLGRYLFSATITANRRWIGNEKVHTHTRDHLLLIGGSLMA